MDISSQLKSFILLSRPILFITVSASASVTFSALIIAHKSAVKTDYMDVD